MNTPRWIVNIALVLILSLLVSPVSAAGSALVCAGATVALTAPAPAPGLVGDDISFNVVIGVDGCDTGVAGAEIFLGYEHTLVEPPASPISVAVPLPDFFGASNVTIAELLTDDPRCPGFHACVHLVAAGPAQTSHAGAAARFHFRGKNVGHACFTLLSSKLVDANGFDVPHGIVSSNPQCVNIVFLGTVKGKVLRQGTPAMPPGPGTLACSEVWSTSGGIMYGPVFTSASGDFVLSGLPPGKHTLHATYPGYLTSATEFDVIVIIGPIVPPILVGATTLHGGDADDIGEDGGDGFINILDIGEIISEFGSPDAAVRSDLPDCVDPDESPDINDNGTININDLAIAAGNWGCTSTRPWGAIPPSRCIP